jgi:hypothetical protein
MSERELVDAYLEGKLASWELVKRLKQLGLTSATAVAVALALPGGVQSGDLSGVKEVSSWSSANESATLARLLEHLSAQLADVGEGGPLQPLVATLARMGANNANLAENANDPKNNNLALLVNVGNVNLAGSLNANVPDEQRAPNLNLRLGGNVGNVNVNLNGSLDVPVNAPGMNVAAVNMRMAGNAGNASLNFSGKLGNIEVAEESP